MGSLACSIICCIVFWNGGAISNHTYCCSGIRNNMLTQTVTQELLAVQGAEHYAYMNMEDVSEELKPVIWEARMEIIFNNSWVADEINGCVLDEAGNVIEVLPHFSELFPEDWEVPRDPNQTYWE